MDLGLKGRNVVVTGGSRGIGRAAALAFAAEGANVAICARSQDALDATRKELEAAGVKAHAASCDVGDAAALAAFLDGARAALGSVEILVNNPSGFGMTDDEAGWKAAVDVDLMATVRATQQVIPWMEAAGGGAIVHISSASGLEAGWPAPYAAIKAALFNHAKTLAAELMPKGIRVNCIAPGSIFFQGGVWDQVQQNMPDYYNATLAQCPAGRMGTPEEVAAAIVFVASPRASWVSGVTLLVDGVQHKGIY
ncbi:MAG: SDR family NAD(P)-dependent oxidoreductase [Gammaproteobacteria bacterium]